MSLIPDSVRNAFASNSSLPEDQQIDQYVQDRTNRAEERIQSLIPYLEERYEMWRGHQYLLVNDKNKLEYLPTKTTEHGGGKRPWVARGSYNLLMDIVAHEVSSTTQRIPNYEVSATSWDPEKRSAARTSEQVAVYGYDQWSVRGSAVDAVTHAVVGQEGFAWPYFDTTVGPMILDAQGKGVIGRGEVKIRVYGPADVMWEPGVRFNDSPYHIVRSDETLQAVVGMPGFLGAAIYPDAETRKRGDSTTKPYKVRLVRVYHYLERPSKSHPVGRWIVIANNRQIAKERPYPTQEGVCLYPLSYISDPDNDRDMGLLQHLMDPMRVFDDAWNKIVEWKNLAINPQMFVAPGVLQGQKITNEPGVVYEIADPEHNIRWREIPQFPQELFTIAQNMNSVIARLAAQNDIPGQVEAGKAIQSLIERDQQRRASFIAQLAEWHGHVASACLRLVQTYYTEPRLLRIKGRWSPDVIADFKGADLNGQVDVRVSPGSIEPRTKEGMSAMVMSFADRQWITPEQAMAAINGGYAGDLVTSYELDQGRALRIIARVKAGQEALFGTPENPAPQRPETQMVTQTDPTTGQPAMDPATGQEMKLPQQVMVADFMPRPFDNIPVQKAVWEDWMKTEEFDALPMESQRVGMEIYQGLLRVEADQAAMQQSAMMAQAAQRGLQGAARPGAPSMPDAKSAVPGEGGPTMNQPPGQSRPRGA